MRFTAWAFVPILLVAIDFRGFLAQGTSNGGFAARYLLLAVPFIAMISARSGERSSPWMIRRLSAGDRFLLLLVLFGLIGSAYGRLVLHTTSTSLALFLPLVCCFTYLGVLGGLEEWEASRVLRRVTLAASLYVFFHAVASSGIAGSISLGANYGHEKAFILALALAGAFATKRSFPFLRWILVVLVAYIYLNYPAATYPIVAFVALLTFFLTNPRARLTRAYVVVLAVIGVGVSAVFSLNRTVAIANKYFAALGKSNNISFRLQLWTIGLHQFAKSPLYGTGFTTNLAVGLKGFGLTVAVPYHNDYVMLGVGGGIIALGLFVSWVVATNLIVVGRLRRLREGQRTAQVDLLRTLLVCFNAWLATAFMNPLFQNLGISAIIVVIYATMMIAATLPVEPEGASLHHSGRLAHQGAELERPGPPIIGRLPRATSWRA